MGKSPYKNRVIKYNNYDYTKHELTSNSYLLKNKSNSNYKTNILIVLYNKSLKNNETKTIKNIANKIKNNNYI